MVWYNTIYAPIFYNIQLIEKWLLIHICCSTKSIIPFNLFDKHFNHNNRINLSPVYHFIPIFSHVLVDFFVHCYMDLPPKIRWWYYIAMRLRKSKIFLSPTLADMTLIISSLLAQKLLDLFVGDILTSLSSLTYEFTTPIPIPVPVLWYTPPK